MALATRQPAGALTVPDARDLFNSFNEEIIQGNLGACPEDKKIVKDGLNLPALLFASSQTKSGKMRRVDVQFGSFAGVPEYDAGDDSVKIGQPGYIKMPDGSIQVLRKTVHKKMDDARGKLIDDGDAVYDYVTLHEKSFFSCYTYSKMLTVPDFSLVWLVNLRIEKTYKPNDDRPATDFVSASAVVSHVVESDTVESDGSSKRRPVPSAYQSKAAFCEMAFSDPGIETMITPDMRNSDTLVVLMVRDADALGKYFAEHCIDRTNHPQVLKTIFSTVFKSDGNDEDRLISHFRNTGESSKCIKFVMQGDRWSTDETYNEATIGQRKSAIRLNMNTWSPIPDVFAVRDVVLWSRVGETLLRAANMVVVGQTDAEYTSQFQDNMDGTAARENRVHLSVRVGALALDYPRTLARCGLKISAATARQMTEALKSNTYNPNTTSFRGKNAKEDDMLNQKSTASMICCVNEMTGPASEIFDDEEFDYRFVMPITSISETFGDDLEKMDAALGDLFYQSKNEWMRQVTLKGAKGVSVDPNHPLRRIVYSTETVMQGLVFNISKKLKADATIQAEMQKCLGLLSRGMVYPTAGNSPVQTMLTIEPAPVPVPVQAPANAKDDDDVNYFGAGADDEPTPAAITRGPKRAAGGSVGTPSAAKKSRQTK